MLRLRPTLSRRALLRGAGGVALGLPMLEAMLPSTARGQAAPPMPRRLVILYQTQGVLMDSWSPRAASTGTGYTFGPILATLDRHKQDMVVMTGIDDESCHLDGINAHLRAPAHLLTAAKMIGTSSQDAATASIDHVIAGRISPPSLPIRSLHLGAYSPVEFSFSGPRAPVDRMVHPRDVFQLVFGGFQGPSPTEDAQAVRRRARRQSVLDSVRGNIAVVNRRLGSADRAILDAYLTRVQEIERRLHATVELSVGCAPVAPSLTRSPYRAAPTPTSFHPGFDRDVSSRAMCDLLVMALACDQTRVVTMAWDQPNLYGWINDVNGNVIRTDNWHNDVVHAGGGTEARPSPRRDWLYRVQQYYHGEVAYLLDQLKLVREGGGSLLDNCLVLYVNEFGNGSNHSHRNKPCFIAGKCGGAIQTGRWLDLGGVPHNRLLLSVCRAFGFQDSSVGDVSLSSAGPISGLV